MTQEKELSLEEMITLARKVEYWERVKDGYDTYVKYTGTVITIDVEVATVYVPASPPENYSGPNYDWGSGKVTSSIRVYSKITNLGFAINDRVDEIINLAKKKDSRKGIRSRAALMKEAKALLRKGN